MRHMTCYVTCYMCYITGLISLLRCRKQWYMWCAAYASASLFKAHQQQQQQLLSRPFSVHIIKHALVLWCVCYFTTAAQGALLCVSSMHRLLAAWCCCCAVWAAAAAASELCARLVCVMAGCIRQLSLTHYSVRCSFSLCRHAFESCVHCVASLPACTLRVGAFVCSLCLVAALPIMKLYHSLCMSAYQLAKAALSFCVRVCAFQHSACSTTSLTSAHCCIGWVGAHTFITRCRWRSL